MTDILLEILNLSKTEVVSMDIISNQEFTEVIDRSSYNLVSVSLCGFIAREEVRVL